MVSWLAFLGHLTISAVWSLFRAQAGNLPELFSMDTGLPLAPNANGPCCNQVLAQEGSFQARCALVAPRVHQNVAVCSSAGRRIGLPVAAASLPGLADETRICGKPFRLHCHGARLYRFGRIWRQLYRHRPIALDAASVLEWTLL